MPKMIGVQSYFNKLNHIISDGTNSYIEEPESINEATKELINSIINCRWSEKLNCEDDNVEDFWYEENMNEPGYWDSLFKHPHEE